MAEKTYPMTLEEKKKLEKELEELKLVRRPEVVERIKIARSYGDLSENSEYEAAKDEQAFVEGQISSLETKIRYAEIVNSDAVAQDDVDLFFVFTDFLDCYCLTDCYLILGNRIAIDNFSIANFCF